MSDNSSGKSNPPTHKGSGYESKNYFSDSLSLDADEYSFNRPLTNSGFD